MKLKAVKHYERRLFVSHNGKQVRKTIRIFTKDRNYLVNEQSGTMHVARSGRNGEHVSYLNDEEMKKYFNYVRPISQAEIEKIILQKNTSL